MRGGGKCLKIKLLPTLLVTQAIFLMKKCFLLCVVALASFACTLRQDNVIQQGQKDPIVFWEGNVKITFSDGAPISTRSSTATYSTLTGQIESTSRTIFIEDFPEENGISTSNHYTDDGRLIATLVYFHDTLIDVELAEEFDDTEILESSGSERFGECLRRNYVAIRDSAREHNPFWCDVLKRTCSVLAAFCAAVECSRVDASDQPEYQDVTP